ncbi:hypothetical protein E2C01_032555 [Portunus trituberculatus]|uniref:Uncharacterized protein n=1 Tax=Portunus trituberculatus TaxID=210409 RepID=A0A5B7F112_PORTR|nr:hypothetical protein [Portunus trituberculatus]
MQHCLWPQLVALTGRVRTQSLGSSRCLIAGYTTITEHHQLSGGYYYSSHRIKPGLPSSRAIISGVKWVHAEAAITRNRRTGALIGW